VAFCPGAAFWGAREFIKVAQHRQSVAKHDLTRSFPHALHYVDDRRPVWHEKCITASTRRNGGTSASPEQTIFFHSLDRTKGELS
jgi:hypothetical protein